MNSFEGKAYNLALWREFKAGSEKALSQIFRQHYTLLYRYGTRISQDQALTEDCIQELFVTLWNNRSTLGETDSIKLYLLKSLKRKLIKAIVKNNTNNQKNYDLLSEHEFQLNSEDMLMLRETDAEKREELSKALKELTPKQKEAIYLRFYKELSYEEVAEIMEVNYQSVRNYIHRAIAILRDMLVFLILFINN